VVNAPGVGCVAADFGRMAERRPLLGDVVRLAFEVGLVATQAVAERGGCRRPRPGRVLPLCFSRQPEFPICRQRTGLARKLRKLAAEVLGLGEVDIADRQVISRRQLSSELARQRTGDRLPLSLRGFVLGDPEPLGQRDIGLVFVRTPFRFAERAPHDEFARWAPLQSDAQYFPFFPGSRTFERGGSWRRWGVRFMPATKQTEREESQ